GELHYICRRKRDMAEHLAKVVLSSEEADKLFKEFHCSQLGGHNAVEKTHGQGSEKRGEYTPIEVTEPLELVGMDLVDEWARGKIKRNNTEVLSKLVAGEPKRWDQFLQSTMFSLRTKFQVTTKFSPYFLMFGKEARVPIRGAQGVQRIVVKTKELIALRMEKDDLFCKKRNAAKEAWE
ncbi:hypothetical protein KUCAC02_002090, partial [Chaenocephalus aceratus]